MGILDIQRAFEKRLLTITPTIQTVPVGVSFTPVTGTPYQKIQLVPRNPENPTMGDGYYREVGEFQIFICYPPNKGTADAIARAELTRSYFQRGTTLTEGGLEVIIPVTPYIAGASPVGDRLIVPVIIQYSVGVI